MESNTREQGKASPGGREIGRGERYGAWVGGEIEEKLWRDERRNYEKRRENY